MSEPLVSIVLLSYNRPALLREALQSVCAQTHARLEIIVVDNRSQASDEISRVVGRHPHVKLIQNPTNVGFAGGMNRGIEAATGEFIYLTEDDIVLDAECVRHLVEHISANASAGVVSPVMYNKAAGTIRCAGGDLSLGGVYRRSTRGEGEADRGQFAHPFDVTYLDGACMFARAEIFRRLGGFREEFFMYVEAVEFCARASKSGTRLAVVPRAKVYHFEPAAGANTSPEFEFHKLKNLFSLYLLHAPARVLPEFFLRYAALATLRTISGGGGHTRTMLKALLWATRRAPALLKERRSGGAKERRSGGAPSARSGLSEDAAASKQSPASRELSGHAN